MTLKTLRKILRRLIKDDPGVQWYDDELNEVLNIAYALVQKEVKKVAPAAHLTWDLINIEANKPWYKLPQTFGLVEVGYRSDTSAVGYFKLEKKRYEDISPVRATSGSTSVVARNLPTGPFYTLRGDYIGIFPTPDTNVTQGIELVHAAISSMAEDTDEPRLKTPLHPAVYLWAAILLLGDTDEQVGELRARLQEILGDLGMWYSLEMDAPIQLTVIK